MTLHLFIVEGATRSTDRAPVAMPALSVKSRCSSPPLGPWKFYGSARLSANPRRVTDVLLMLTQSWAGHPSGRPSPADCSTHP